MGAFGVAAFSCRQVTAPSRGIQSHRLGRWSLLEISKFEDGLFEIKEIDNKSKIQLPSQDEDPVMRKVSKEVKVWTFEDYLGHTRPHDKVLELYGLLNESVANITRFEHDYKKVYIAFKHNRENIFDCAFTKNKIKIWINLGWGDL